MSETNETKNETNETISDERERRAASPVGYATAMRDALLRCDAIAQLPETREFQSIKDMRNLIRNALSEPMRNCDRFATEEEARKAFYRVYFGPTESEYVDAAFVTWLFAPAKEGGAE